MKSVVLAGTQAVKELFKPHRRRKWGEFRLNLRGTERRRGKRICGSRLCVVKLSTVSRRSLPKWLERSRLTSFEKRSAGQWSQSWSAQSHPTFLLRRSRLGVSPLLVVWCLCKSGHRSLCSCIQRQGGKGNGREIFFLYLFILARSKIPFRSFQETSLQTTG